MIAKADINKDFNAVKNLKPKNYKYTKNTSPIRILKVVYKGQQICICDVKTGMGSRRVAFPYSIRVDNYDLTIAPELIKANPRSKNFTTQIQNTFLTSNGLRQYVRTEKSYI